MLSYVGTWQFSLKLVRCNRRFTWIRKYVSAVIVTVTVSYKLTGAKYFRNIFIAVKK
jgi:hypothetical protein